MNIRWTEDANLDVGEIYDYIAADKRGAAISVVQRLHEAVSGLADMPLRGRLRDGSSLRELVVPGLPYIVYYAIESEDVLIVRVLHSAMASRPIQ